MSNPTWRIIHIGYLKQNPFWDEEEILRDQRCTTLLIETGIRRILVDPGFSSEEAMRTALYRHSGLHPDDIDTIFLTHFHRNHWHSLPLFTKSVWLMARTEIRYWQRNAKTTSEELDLLARIVPIEEHSIPEIESIPTPGHTHGSTSLLFETREGMVVVAGDAVLTFDHFDSRESSDLADDKKEARRSIDRIAHIADIVIPGHDNYFVV